MIELTVESLLILLEEEPLPKPIKVTL